MSFVLINRICVKSSEKVHGGAGPDDDRRHPMINSPKNGAEISFSEHGSESNETPNVQT